MKIFTCADFTGHWPIGTSAVIVAEDIDQARAALAIEVLNYGLPPLDGSEEIEEVDISKPQALILQDGNY